MKILIIGEYSGFAKNLKLGFEALGHNVVLFQEGDSWKKIDAGNNSYVFGYRENFKLWDINLPKSWLLKGCYYFPKFKTLIKKYSNSIDVVLIINPQFIRLSYEFWHAQFSINDIKKVLRKDGQVYLSACGDDYAYLGFTSNFRYTTPKKNLNRPLYFSKRGLAIFKSINNCVVGVIPVMYEYAAAYRNLNKFKFKILPTIPLPINSQAIVPHNVLNEKIVIFHGLNRSSKGTEIIIEALNIIKVKYVSRVEIIIDGKMPLTDYLKLLQTANIVIDQCYGYSYGMNALYSMAMGKVVLSGNEPECEDEFGIKNIPIINILPEVNDIVLKIEKLIECPNLIKELSIQSVNFVNGFHDNVKVASKYIDLFNTK